MMNARAFGRCQRVSKRRGLALLMVLVHSVLLFSAWALANRRTVDLIRLKGCIVRREEADGPGSSQYRRFALAHGVMLLGFDRANKITDGYKCRVSLYTDANNTPRDYVLTFRIVQLIPSSPGVEQRIDWEITAREQSLPEDEALPRPLLFPP